MNNPPILPESAKLLIAARGDEQPMAILDAEAKGMCSMSDASYFAAVTPSVITASRLKSYAGSAWQGFFEDHQDAETTEALKFGSLVHACSLTPQLLSSRYVVGEKRVAVKKDGTPYANGMQDPAQKEAWQKLEENGITIVTPEQQLQALAMASSAAHAINCYWGELTEWQTEQVLWVHEGNYRYQGKADAINPDLALIVDIKTTNADVTDDRALFREISKYLHGIQAMQYKRLFEAVHEKPLDSFAFCFVSKQPPYLSRLVVISAETIQQAYGAPYAQALSNLETASLADYAPTPALSPIHL